MGSQFFYVGAWADGLHLQRTLAILWSVSGTLSFWLLLKFERHREWTQLIIYQFFLKQADCSFQALDLKRTLTDINGHLQTNQHNFP